MSKPILNLDELERTMGPSHGGKFEAKIAPIDIKLGARGRGDNVTRGPAGKRAFPLQSHHASEQMRLVLEGQGRLRFGKDEFAVRKGDFIACPPGGAEVAQQRINGGDGELVRVARSTRIDTDAFSYPDAGKAGAIGGVQAGTNSPPQASFPAKFFVEAAAVDYWKGE